MKITYENLFFDFLQSGNRLPTSGNRLPFFSQFQHLKTEAGIFPVCGNQLPLTNFAQIFVFLGVIDYPSMIIEGLPKYDYPNVFKLVSMGGDLFLSTEGCFSY